MNPVRYWSLSYDEVRRTHCLTVNFRNGYRYSYAITREAALDFRGTRLVLPVSVEGLGMVRLHLDLDRDTLSCQLGVEYWACERESNYAGISYSQAAAESEYRHRILAPFQASDYRLTADMLLGGSVPKKKPLEVKKFKRNIPDWF